MLLGFKVGKEKDHTGNKTAEADYRNNENRINMSEEKLYKQKNNAAPDNRLNRLAYSVVFDKVDGKGKIPYKGKRRYRNNAPIRAADDEIYRNRGKRCRNKGPTQNVEKSAAVCGA